MAEFISTQFTRITSAATWTEVAGSNKGLNGFSTNDVAELDVLIQNWDADDATILVAITSDDQEPASDDVATLREVKKENEKIQLQVILKGAAHLWVKSDQTDTRVTVSGTTEDN